MEQANVTGKPKYAVLFESAEEIRGYHTKSRSWIHYSALLTVKNGSGKPVTIDMESDSVQLFILEIPVKYRIQAETITDAYATLVKFFEAYGIILRSYKR